MPYSGPDDSKLPVNVRKLDRNERARWVAIFNHTIADKDEATAFRIANGVLKRGSEMKNKHFLARMYQFFTQNKDDLLNSDPKAFMRNARAYAGGKQKAENRMSMSEQFGKNGDWRLFFEQSFAEPPAKIQVLPRPGTYSHARYGKFTITASDIQKFVDNHNRHVYQNQIPIDAEHETKQSGALGYYGEMRLLNDGKDGAEADINWTDRGHKLIASDRFKYFSPEWFDTWKDPATEQEHKNVLVGGAVTTRPFFKDKVLHPLVASAHGYEGGEIVVDTAGAKTASLEVFQFSEDITPDPSVLISQFLELDSEDSDEYFEAKHTAEELSHTFGLATQDPSATDALSDKLHNQLQALAQAGAKVKIKVKKKVEEPGEDETKQTTDPLDLMALIAQILDISDDDDNADEIKQTAEELASAFMDPEVSDVHVNSLVNKIKAQMSAMSKLLAANNGMGVGAMSSKESYWFREYTQEQRDAYAKSGIAMPDGSYPIPDKDALDDAIRSYGRSPDRETKDHIMKRARALGAASMLPENWTGGKKAVELNEETKAFVEEQTKKLTGELDKERGLRQASEERMLKLESESRTRRFSDIISGRDGEGDGSPAFPGDKAPHHEVMGLIAEKYGEDSDQFRAYVAQQRAVSKQMHEGGLFKEIGKGAGPGGALGNTPASKAFNEAVELWGKENPGKNKAEAITAVAKADPDLYTRQAKETTKLARQKVGGYAYEEEED